MTPQGNLTYTISGTNPDGTPQYTQTQTYSPEQQTLYNQQNQVAQALNSVAIDNIGRVQDAQSKPFNYDNMTPLATSAGAGNPFQLQQSPVAGQYGYGVDGGAIQNSAGVGRTQDTVADPGGIQRGIADSGGLQWNIANAGDIHNTLTAGSLQNGAQGAGTAQGIDPALAGRGVQGGLDYSRLTALPGTGDFGAESQRMAQSVYSQAASRLDPRFQQSDSDMRSRLAAQGISENSDAYRRELDNASRDRNDAYNQAAYSAQQAGANEQSRLFGLSMNARQQGQNEVNAQGQFTNAAQGQSFDQTLAAQNANQSVQGQNFGQNLANAQFYNAAQGQNFDQQAIALNAHNAAQAQQYGQNANDAQFSNATQQQLYGENANSAQFTNAAQAQQYGQNANNAQLFNSAQQQAYAQRSNEVQLNNAAQDQTFGQGVQNRDMFNQAQQANFSNAQSAAGFNNQAQNQYFNQSAANSTFNNQARQQQIQEATYLRNLPLNDIASLLSGNSAQNPSFSNYAQVGVAAPDYQGLVMNNYNQALAQYNQQQQARSQGLGSIFGAVGSIGSALALSDRRFKENIKRIGTLANGLATYAFNYIGDAVQQFGVMAQEALGIVPDAVVEKDGVMYVDYGRIY